MHRFVANELILQLSLEPCGPVPIKTGEQKRSTDPSLPDMCFVRTMHRFGDRGLVPTIYLPGSSLKGPIRAYCERVGLSAHKAAAAEAGRPSWRLACVSVSREGVSDFPYCGEQFKDQQEPSGEGEAVTSQDGRSRYRESCMTCQIFGNTALAAHLSIDDAYPADVAGIQTDVRTNVAIDRVLGSAVGPFEMEVVVGGRFVFSLRLWNFSWAHLGLLSLALEAFNSDELLIGSGKSRGLGRVRVQVEHMTLRTSPLLADHQGQVADITAKRDGKLIYAEYLPEPLQRPTIQAWTVPEGRLEQTFLGWQVTGDRQLWHNLRSHAQHQFQRLVAALLGGLAHGGT
jgi:CRISPR/Cas system CSM-associated protein Csm3 (group 7 of RAMP superfamily)